MLSQANEIPSYRTNRKNTLKILKKKIFKNIKKNKYSIMLKKAFSQGFTGRL